MDDVEGLEQCTEVEIVRLESLLTRILNQGSVEGESNRDKSRPWSAARQIK